MSAYTQHELEAIERIQIARKYGDAPPWESSSSSPVEPASHFLGRAAVLIAVALLAVCLVAYRPVLSALDHVRYGEVGL